MTYGRWFFVMGVSLVLSRCAQIVGPSGGPKDTTPPTAVQYEPDSAAVSFSGKKIEIAFNEYIQLSELQKQVEINPFVQIQPEIRVKGKSVIIEWKDTLRQNTTYSIFFGDAIRDITENNKKNGFRYVFSTGPSIDTLSVKGMVRTLPDMKTEKGILVMLYDLSDDSLPYHTMPTYFTRTQDNGSFLIPNVHPGKYKIFALKDANGDFLYNLPEETIGFSDTLLDLRSNRKVDLLLFREEPSRQKLIKATYPERGHLFFVFAKPVEQDLKLQFLSRAPQEKVIYEYSKNTDTLHYWFADELKDSLKLRVLYRGEVLDSLKFKPVSSDAESGSGRGARWACVVSANVRTGQVFDLNREITLTFNHPLQAVNSGSGIVFTRDSVDISSWFTRKKYDDYIGKRRITMDSTQAKEGASYKLMIPAGTFIDIYGLPNDTLKAEYKAQEEKNYGSLKLNLKMNIRIAYILEMVNDAGQRFSYASSDKGVFSFTLLPPGNYKIRIIYDKDGDGKWTTGNYLKKRKPETVLYFSSPQTIRAGWENEVDWKVE